MKILAVTDLHYHKPWFSWVADQAKTGSFGAVMVAGDGLGYLNSPADQENGLRTWLERFPVPIFWSRGGYDPSSAKLAAIKNPNFHAGGVWVLGSWRIVVVDVWCDNAIPETLAQTVVVSHFPPAGTMCARAAGASFDAAELGRGDVRTMINRISDVRVAICGSVHEPAGHHDAIGNTLVINTGMAHNEHSGIPSHAVIDLDRRHAAISTGRVSTCVDFSRE